MAYFSICVIECFLEFQWGRDPCIEQAPGARRYHIGMFVPSERAENKRSYLVLLSFFFLLVCFGSGLGICSAGEFLKALTMYMNMGEGPLRFVAGVL